MNIREHLPLVEAPESVWNAIEAAMREGRQHPARPVLRWRIISAAAAAIFFAAAGAYWFGIHPAQWVETGPSAHALLKIGNIGLVDLGPNTRLRVVTDRADQHRLMLEHGAIYAKITAPPRLFFVDTKSGTAIDLGCEYALNMDESGWGWLRVSKGWVSFQWKGLESLVPAGAVCHIRPTEGPEVPYFEDATPEFAQAVERDSLDSILGAARPRDTLTLWHLLWRVAPGDRVRVYDRIAALTPIPAEISRERVLALDRQTLEQLKEELAWKW
ncbi:MAG TPA: FecR domain-containing protein [Bryobacteraceae bacterium]|nr:FecR domain-containing protein [Bryobacteraceae bacterium]